MEATDEQLAEQLQTRVDALRERACCGCGGQLCGHELLFSIALGASDNPRCASCLALAMGMTTSQLRDQLLAHFQHRDCYGEIWGRESQREGYARDSLPGCLWSETEATIPRGESNVPETARRPLDEASVGGWAFDAWDAGDMSCGDLVLALRRRLQALTPGTRLKLTARDPGASEDIPAWCRMTGHQLLAQHHPHYWIQRKEE